MTFIEAYATHGPDVETIAASLLWHIEPWMVDRLVSRALDRRYEQSRLSPEKRRRLA